MTPPALRIDRLTLRHDRHDAVRDLSGVFLPGSLTALVGPNGAGKTTLLRALVGLHRPASGGIDRGGLRPADIAMLPQGSQLDRQFPIACRDVVALGLAGRLGPFQQIGRAQRAAAEDALAAVGLPDHGGRPIGALSSGQFQRVLFARMMLQDAPVLLLDEPFSAVDAATEDDLLHLLHDWHAQGRTIVAVLHDLDLVRAAFPHTLLLAREKIAWGPTEAALTDAHCHQAGLLRDRRHLRPRVAA
ncbi:MAG: ABC transporter ATP-binding protein [Acetobacteraceae bacterium]|nr:ABC transporter ATP-binding protein [Acetobacteraceae bacterium]